MKKIFVLTLFAFVIKIADAGIDGIAYECSQFDKTRDGFTCVPHVIEKRSYLFMRFHNTAELQKDKKFNARRSHLVNGVIHNFMVAGGYSVEQRTNRPSDGKTVQRFCTRRRGTNKENCGDWFEPESQPDSDYDKAWKLLGY